MVLNSLVIVFMIAYLGISIVHGIEICRERCAVHPRLKPKWWVAGAVIEGFLAIFLWPLAVASRAYENHRPIVLVKRRRK